MIFGGIAATNSTPLESLELEPCCTSFLRVLPLCSNLSFASSCCHSCPLMVACLSAIMLCSNARCRQSCSFLWYSTDHTQSIDIETRTTPSNAVLDFRHIFCAHNAVCSMRPESKQNWHGIGLNISCKVTCILLGGKEFHVSACFSDIYSIPFVEVSDAHEFFDWLHSHEISRVPAVLQTCYQV